MKFELPPQRLLVVFSLFRSTVRFLLRRVVGIGVYRLSLFRS